MAVPPQEMEALMPFLDTFRLSYRDDSQNSGICFWARAIARIPMTTQTH
ncbi:hypothetical protein H6F78_09140 [Coleofasciculus sp. FACHB-64]|nr:hypothetical protein [Coleofasciculus sp. FACHB-SPT9]MBD1943353.1 hypothetical protein [Coleofasciculus sp. FACHB-712]MBD2045761.1 hypothetical protein [Coleofasciculus sp. FACHB-64]